MSDRNNGPFKRLRFIIDHYKANFDTVNKQELYKWEALKWYKDHWNIEAEDFAQMLIIAFSKTANLLSSGMYFPYKMLCEYAKEDPESVRGIFHILHDEQRSLTERYEIFKNSCQSYVDGLKKKNPERQKSLNHYQDPRAVMVYLTFQYPEKYYLFKSTMYTTFRDRTDYAEPKAKINSAMHKVERYMKMCDILLSEIQKDAELVAMHRARLTDNCYQDPDLHLLTMDIVFYGSNYMSEELFVPGDSYWPPLRDYDPGITEEMWFEILQDEDTTSKEALALLQMILNLGGESTFDNIVSQFKTQIDYKTVLQNFSDCVIRKANCAACPKGYKEFAKYIIPFVGRTIANGTSKGNSWKLRHELKAALERLELPNHKFADTGDEKNMPPKTDISLNTILYGPPGTGKTYHTAIYAVAIIENKLLDEVKKESYNDVFARYNTYRAQGLIEFTTFHQSYGYEEFIEGIRPAVIDDGDEADAGDIQYSVQPGMFKKFCEKAECPVIEKTTLGDLGIRDGATIWKVSLEGAGENQNRTECLENGHIRIGWDGYGKEITDETDFSQVGGKKVLNAFINRMQIGDVVLSCYNASTIDAIGVVTGEYEWHDEYAYMKRLRKVRWLAKGIRENILELNGGKAMTLSSVYRMTNLFLSDVYRLIEKYRSESPFVAKNKQNHVFIIDEINRGNISKIFGELITLIEETKRVGKAEEMKALLPYSMKPFGIPDNVYIIGTMNTADRSIAMIDTALRRRFAFKEMLPDPEVLARISVGTISVEQMLDRMNRRITVLYDREHTIGHAYFLPLKQNNSITVLADIFKNKIIPLLQEYFYEDYEKIRLVLGDNQVKEDAKQFILAKKIQQNELFGNADIGLDDAFTYEINEDAFTNPEAYQKI